MLTANCLQKTKYGCKKEPVTLTVTDEMGNRFFARTNCDDCYNIIYNKVPYSILDKYKEPAFSRLHPRGYLVRFTIENRFVGFCRYYLESPMIPMKKQADIYIEVYCNDQHYL